MTGLGRARLVAWCGVGLLLVACQASGGSPSATLNAESAAEPLGSGELTRDLDLQVGDCFNPGDESRVAVVPCDEPHVYEGFAVFDYAADADQPYPGEDALFEFADAECQARFEAYVGVAYQASELFYTSVSPSEATWSSGDRENVCALHRQDKAPLTGSAEGSRQ